MSITTSTCILISTFNGSRFLSAQLESLFSQTNTDWCLLARDDGSCDDSVAKLQDFRKKFPEKIQIVNDTCRRLGPAASFSKLLNIPTCNYIFFCDQDDVWLPEKMSRTIAAMLEAEQQYGTDTPLLVHTDLHVVDEHLQPVANSLCKYQCLFPQLGSQLNHLLLQNVVTGCTMMINRPLVKLAAPIPEGAIMHDWWLALVATSFGKIIFLDEPTMLYRQHSSNSVGAKRWGVKQILQQAQDPGTVCKSMLRTIFQAQLMLDRYRDQLNPAKLTVIEAYARLPFMSKTDRVKMIFKYRFFRHKVIETIGVLASLLMLTRNTK